MSTTTDPAPSATPPAEAELIRRAREWAGTLGPRERPRDLLDALAVALGRAARERDARSDEAGAGRELARAVLESWADASLAERCPAASIPATDALRFAALRVLGRPIGGRDGGAAGGEAPRTPPPGPASPRPCPFCGPGADTDLTREDGTDRLYRECLACGATGPKVATLDEAAADAAWDRRAEDAPAAGGREKGGR